MKEIKREDIKVGDIVGVPFVVSIGWSHFRYNKIIPMEVARITPARTKIVMTNGRELGRYDRVYELDDKVKYETKVAECAKNISSKMYELEAMSHDGTLFRKNDDKLIEVSALLDKVMEVLTNESH